MKFLFNLLNAAATSSGGGEKTSDNGWVIWLILIGVCVVMFVISSRQRKKQQAQIEERMNALKPGDRILTIGLINAAIEEIYDNGTILISTGSGDKISYLLIERNAIYKTINEDPAFQPEAPEDAFEQAPVEQAPVEQAPVEEAPVEEVSNEVQE